MKIKLLLAILMLAAGLWAIVVTIVIAPRLSLWCSIPICAGGGVLLGIGCFALLLRIK